jgi:hypothetical protein
MSRAPRRSWTNPVGGVRRIQRSNPSQRFGCALTSSGYGLSSGGGTFVGPPRRRTPLGEGGITHGLHIPEACSCGKEKLVQHLEIWREWKHEGRAVHGQ